MARTCQSVDRLWRGGWVAGVGLAMLASGLGCGSNQPRFGSLDANARKLDVKSSIRLFELSNGMLVALAPDQRTNLVSVDMRYGVGGAQDPAHRRGLAHLLEHLTFQFPSGSAGATIGDRLTAAALSYNAGTSHDYTHYMATALAERVDALLELEAQRLEARCELLDDAQVVRERDVVLAEEAQRRTDVTDVAIEVATAVWGAGHPYARPLTTRDMAQATKAEVCELFDAHYVPERAMLIVTGNLDPDALQARIGKRFGPIAREPQRAIIEVAAPRLSGGETAHVADVDHALAQIYLPAPAWGAEGEAVHDMTLMALRYALDALDRETDWIVETDVGYAGAGRQRATAITVAVSDPARLGAAVDAVLARGRDLFEDEDRDGNAGDNDDPDDQDVTFLIGQIRGRLQTVAVMRADAIQGRGYWLGNFLQYTTHNNFMLENLRAIDTVTPQALVDHARRLFDRQHAHVALIRPTGDAKSPASAFVAVEGSGTDLEPWRVAIDPAEAARPLSLPRNAKSIEIDDYRFENGLRVLLFLDPTSPIIDARMVYPVGKIDDAPDRPGVADFAAELLDHDLDRAYVRHSIDLINWTAGLGTLVWADVGDATTVFNARGLGVYGDWHVWRLSWLLDQGAYPKPRIQARRQQARDEGDDDESMADLAFWVRLFGFGHPHAAPPPTAAQVARIDQDQLAAWRDKHYTTAGATLIVTGGFDRDQMKRTVAELFGVWRKRGPAPRRTVPAPAPAPGPSWIGVRRSGAPQVELSIGFTARSSARDDRAARMVLVEMIRDRLRVVREGMGASYGVYGSYRGGTTGSALVIETALEASRASEAAATVLAELASLRTDAAAHAADFARARRRVLTRVLATMRDATTVAAELESMVVNQLDVAQLQGLPAAVAQLTPAAVAQVAAADLDPTRMVVAVKGRAKEITATLTSLGATDPAWFSE